jgi:hypothetical protein
MGTEDFSQEAIDRAMSLFSSTLEEARRGAQEGDYLTLQGQLRKAEEKARGLHYSERFNSLDNKIAALEMKIKNR